MPRRKQKKAVMTEEDGEERAEEALPHVVDDEGDEERKSQTKAPRTSRRAKTKRKKQESSDEEEEESILDEEEEEEKRSKKKTKKSNSSTSKKKKTSSSSKKKKAESELEEEDENEPMIEKDQTEDVMEDEEKNNTITNASSITTPTEEEVIPEEQPEDAVGDLDLTKIQSENSFVMETIQNVMQFQSVLQNVESGYATLSSEDRHKILSILKHQQRKIGKLVEICNSAELLLFRGAKNDLSEYGILNKIELVEVWAVVFSFLKFSDWLKASQVCKLWKKASEEPYSLSSLQFDFKYNFQHKHILEVYREYFAERKIFIRYASDIPGMYNDDIFCRKKKYMV